MRTIRWLGFAILIALLCGETAYILMEGSNNGSRLAWQMLSAPPERAAHIAWVSGTEVVVETTSHNYFSCTIWSDQKCWKAVKIDQYQGQRFGQLWQPSSDLAPPQLPRATEIQYVLDSSPADFVILAAYAIEDDGTVLAWRQSNNWIDLLVNGLPAVFGGAVGLVGTLLVAALACAWPQTPVKRRA